MEQPNYTQIPNVLLDRLPDFGDAELRTILCMCRQTFGWHRDRTNAMSSAFIAKNTGMSQQAVIKSTKSLMERGMVRRTKCRNSFSYEVDVSLEPAGDPPPKRPAPGPETLNGVERGEKIASQPGLEFRAETLNGVETLALETLNGVERNKEREIKKDPPAGEDPAPGAPAAPARDLKAEHAQFVRGWCEMFERKFGHKYAFHGGKDGAAVKRLLSTDTAPSLLGLVSRAWAQKDQRSSWACVNQTGDIASFASAVNRVRQELYNAKRKQAFI